MRLVTGLRKRLSLASSALLVLVTIVVVGGSATPASASCTHSSRDAGSALLYVTGTDVAVRSGPHTSCGLNYRAPNGLIMNAHCYVTGDTVKSGGISYTTWSRVSVWGGGPGGWMSDAFLENGGAPYRC